MDAHGWADIAYSMGVCQHGYVFAGRGANTRTAANGTNHGNSTHYAVCWIGGGKQQPSAKALSAFAWCVKELRSHGGAGKSVKPHRFFKSTGCPGTELVSAAKSIDGRNLTAGRDYITVGDQGPEVETWQRDLMRWDSKALPDYGADGDFGGETTEWTLKFCDSRGLKVSSRNAPRVGDDTREELKKALEGPQDEWEVFWMSLNNNEKAILKDFIKAIEEEGTNARSFVRQLLKRHRYDIPALEGRFEQIDGLVERGETSLQGVVIGGVNAIDAVRDLGYDITTSERTGPRKSE